LASLLQSQVAGPAERAIHAIPATDGEQSLRTPTPREPEHASPDAECLCEHFESSRSAMNVTPINACKPDLFYVPSPAPEESAQPEGDSQEDSAPQRLFLHDLALTMGAEAATVLVSLLLTSLLSRWLGPRVLSEYLLLRRVLAWMIAGTLLGLATGLPRYVAHAAGQRSRSESSYFLAASICLIPSAIVTGLVMVLNRNAFAQWFFGDGRETGLVMALALLLLGFAIHHAVYGYYRGLLEMTRANLFELCNTALLPLGVVLLLFRTEPIGAIMFALGGLMTITGTLFAVPIFFRLRRQASLGPIYARCGELLHYGVPRVPGEFGAAAITAIGPMLAAHYMEIARVSPLLLGLNMLMVTGYAAGPLGVVLLSKVSMMLGQNQREEVQSRLRLLVAAVMEVSVFTCIQLAIFADVIVRAWVGPGYEDQMGVIRLVLLAIPPYLFFVALRSTIDAATVKPANTANVLISLAVYLGLIAGWIMFFSTSSLLMAIAGSLLASQLLLATLTARTFRTLYGLTIPWRKLFPAFTVALLLGAVAVALRTLQTGLIPFLEAMLVETVLLAVYLAALAHFKSGWVAYTWNVGVRRRTDWPTDSSGL
jgi:O-antigen/teichoic acid export membrane protein